MKRLLTAILALVLLTGCATQVPVETTDVTAAASAADTRELYDPSNPVAQAAGSTIRAYGLDAGCTGIAKMGDDLLLFFTQDGQTRLLLCAGKNCAVKAEATLDCVLAPGSGTLAVSDKGIAYYDAAAPVGQPQIIHYNVDCKPWHRDEVRYEAYFWDYANRSPFREEILRVRRGYTEADTAKSAEETVNLIAMATSQALDRAENRRIHAEIAKVVGA